MVPIIIYYQDGNGATGVVLRDSSGQFLGGVARWHEHCQGVVTRESVSCWDGLIFSRQHGASRVSQTDLPGAGAALVDTRNRTFICFISSPGDSGAQPLVLDFFLSPLLVELVLE